MERRQSKAAALFNGSDAVSRPLLVGDIKKVVLNNSPDPVSGRTSAASSGSDNLKIDNENRSPRGLEEMQKEAEWLTSLLRPEHYEDQ